MIWDTVSVVMVGVLVAVVFAIMALSARRVVRERADARLGTAAGPDAGGDSASGEPGTNHWDLMGPIQQGSQGSRSDPLRRVRGGF